MYVRLFVLMVLVAYSYYAGVSPNTRSHGFRTAVAYGLLVFGPMLYLLPTYEAFRLRQPKRLTVALLNLFLGWTVVGWVVAWVMAIKKPEVVLPDGEESGYFDSELLVRGFSIVNCPKCGEKVKEDAVKCKHCGTLLTPAG